MTDTFNSLQLSGPLICTPPISGRPLAKYVFQKTRAGKGNLPNDPAQAQQVRLWVLGRNPRSPGQQQRRGLFAAGVIAWKALSENDKTAWRARCARTPLNAYQYFLQQFCKAQTIGTLTVWSTDFDDPHTAWDYGATKFNTVWDGGLTLFID